MIDGEPAKPRQPEGRLSYDAEASVGFEHHDLQPEGRRSPEVTDFFTTVERMCPIFAGEQKKARRQGTGDAVMGLSPQLLYH